MKTNLILDHGHFFAEIEGALYLIDTGSPFSVGASEITISGKTYSLNEGMVTMDSINGSGLFDCHASGLLGIDILSDHEVVIDCEQKSVYWNEDMASQFSTVKIQHVAGMLPTIPANIDGRQCKVVLDSGAWVSYVKEDVVSGKVRTGEIDDWNPFIGKIHAPTYSVDIIVADSSSVDEMAVMPKKFEALLSQVGVDAVISLNHVGSRTFLFDISKGLFGVR